MKSNITFRVESSLKEEFIKAAAANGTTATALFHEWMRSYINSTNGSTNNSTNTETNSTNTEDNSKESCTNSIDDETISTNTEQIKKLTARIDEMEERISAQDKTCHWLLDKARQQREYMDGLSCPLYSNLSDQRHLPQAATNDSNNASTPARVVGGGKPEQEANTSNGSIVAPDQLTKPQLAARLNRSEKIIDNRKGKKEFLEWSKERDPEGIKWKWNYDTKIFERVF